MHTLLLPQYFEFRTMRNSHIRKCQVMDKSDSNNSIHKRATYLLGGYGFSDNLFINANEVITDAIPNQASKKLQT